MDRIDSGVVSTEDDETLTKFMAYKRREWLSALLETGNEKVVAAYEKYKKVNPAKIENPGSLSNIEIWVGSTSPLTVEKLSAMSNVQIAGYLVNFKEPEIVIRKSDPTEEGLARTLNECITATPQRFTDDLKPFQDVKNFYQNWMLHGFLSAWRDNENLDWTALLRYFGQILSSERFWAEQHNVSSNYRQWTLLTMADLIASGMEDDKRAIDAQLLPLAEQILLILVEKVEPSGFSYVNRSSDILSSDRSKVFSAMMNYALRFARNNDIESKGCRWPYSIRVDFTKRLNRSVESSLEFSYTLGFYLPNLLYLDKEWVVENIDRIFPQRDEDHWQAAFSGYLLRPGVHEVLYPLLKAGGHYLRALNARFADAEVLDGLVNHICMAWIEDSEVLNDKTSLIFQLIHSGNPDLLVGMVYFFARRADNLSDKVKVKVIPAWRALFGVLSQRSNEVAYQKILSPLSGWLELIDKIDDEILVWVRVSIKYIDKLPGYALTLSNVIKALQQHVLITPKKVGKIYLEIPESELWFIEQTQRSEVGETIRILYEKGHKDIADDICNRFGEAGANFLGDLYVEFQH
ncbi:hypothetical protein C6500_03400 [Candidatus Poribacteria bacterium]|nr:MAG: hypothetical protein C6500_03400 [Candidatus Poribacteria bacterium]